MMADAHPDDENNGLLVMLNRGQGYRTTLATATRGNGGQNEIGPEIFEALGVLRTEELAALHRFDGAEQYFTRAVDFGFSFSIDETLEKWGRDEIIGDYVRLIRTIRPDVITAMAPTAIGPGQHCTSRRVRRSCRARRTSSAGDPTKYPEQIKDGLRPWQPKKFYLRVGGLRRRRRGRQPARAPDDALRPRRVRSAARQDVLGDRHRGAQHAQVPGAGAAARAARAVGSARISCAESTIAGADGPRRAARSSTASTRRITGLAKFAGARAAEGSGRRPRGRRAERAGRRRRSSTPKATRRRSRRCSPACTPCACCAASSARMPIDDTARFEIDFRLRQKEREFQQAALVANGIRVEALADDGVVVPGQPVKVSVHRRQSRRAPTSTVKQVKFDGFDGDAACALDAGDRGGRARRRWRRAEARRRRRPGAGADADLGSQDGSGRALRSDVEDSGQRARHRAVLASRRRRGPLHVRRRRAVRPAVPADAVLRAGHADVPDGTGDRRRRSAACRCSTATRATSSAARSARSCSWCRRSRCACRPTSW